MKFKRTLALASEPSIVLRGLKYAVIVGSILVAINHGDRVLHGTISTYQWCQIALTYAVPYVVSSLSSVQLFSNEERTRAGFNDWTKHKPSSFIVPNGLVRQIEVLTVVGCIMMVLG